MGVTIAMLTVLVIYHAFAATESLRRDTQSAGEAQQTGLFVLARLTHRHRERRCGIRGQRFRVRLLSGVDGHRSDDASDHRADHRRRLRRCAGRPCRSLRRRDHRRRRAAIRGAGPGRRQFHHCRHGRLCARRSRRSQRAAGAIALRHAWSPSPAQAPGQLEIAHTPVAIDLPDTSALLNLGPDEHVQTLRFDMAGNVLRTTDLAGGDAPESAGVQRRQSQVPVRHRCRRQRLDRHMGGGARRRCARKFHADRDARRARSTGCGKSGRSASA